MPSSLTDEATFDLLQASRLVPASAGTRAGLPEGELQGPAGGLLTGTTAERCIGRMSATRDQTWTGTGTEIGTELETGSGIERGSETGIGAETGTEIATVIATFQTGDTGTMMIATGTGPTGEATTATGAKLASLWSLVPMAALL